MEGGRGGGDEAEFLARTEYDKVERYPVNGIERSPEWFDATIRLLEHLRRIRYASTRLWHPDSHLLGLAGNIALNDLYGAQLDTRIRLGGDGGVDAYPFMRITGKFEWIKQDVKCATFAKELWTGGVNEKSPTRPDHLYVLAQHLGRLDARLEGWEWGHEMLKIEPQLKGGKWNHTKSKFLLRPISELEEYYCKRWKWHDDPSAPLRGYPAQYPNATVG